MIACLNYQQLSPTVRKCFEQLIEEHFELDERYKKLCNIYYRLCEKYCNLKPYKFEDLKPGVWVFDSKREFIYLIHEVHEEDMTIEVVVNDRDVQHMKVVTLGTFEENRFYPVQIANRGINND